MQKLAKRELIILGIMAAVVIYGVFSFFQGGAVRKSPSPPAPSSAELKTMTADIARTLSGHVLSAGEAYAVSRAEALWMRDPFFDKKVYREMLKPQAESFRPAAEAKKRPVFDFTGFMEFSGKQIAVINGIEYHAGEALDTPGYVLTDISPEKAVIENKAEGVKIEVPLLDWQ